MVTKTIFLLSLSFLGGGLLNAMHEKNYRTVEFIMDAESMCPGLVAIFEEDRTQEQEDIIDKLTVRSHRPMTLLHSHRGKVRAFNGIMKKEAVCSNIAVFLQNLEDFPLIYKQVQLNYHTGDVILVTSNSSRMGDKILQDSRSERIYLLIERGQRLVEIHKWMVSNRLRIDYVLRNNNLSWENLRERRQKLQGRYLTIATLDFPPIVFAKEDSSGKVIVFGIEPSLMTILAERLDFKVRYILPLNDEMWVSTVPLVAFTADSEGTHTDLEVKAKFN